MIKDIFSKTQSGNDSSCVVCGVVLQGGGGGGDTRWWAALPVSGTRPKRWKYSQVQSCLWQTLPGEGGASTCWMHYFIYTKYAPMILAVSCKTWHEQYITNTKVVHYVTGEMSFYHFCKKKTYDVPTCEYNN